MSQNNPTSGPLEVHTLQVIDHLTLEGVPPEGLPLVNFLRIATNPALKEKIIDDYMWWACGEIDAKWMLAAQSFAQGYIRLGDRFLSPDHAREIRLAFTFHVDLLFLAMWLVKDHSASASTLYMRVEKGEGIIPFSARERQVTTFTTSGCEHIESIFTRIELDQALAYVEKIHSVLPKVGINEPIPHQTGANADARITRVLYFLQSGRRENDIAIKIAFYAICFESLFSTDMAGVAHRVAERAATFITKSGSDRQRAYRDVHHLYDARSRVVHGSTIGKKKMAVPTLIEVAKRCDEHLRQCIRRILNDDTVRPYFINKSDDEIRDHFLSELFPPNSDAIQEDKC